MRVPHMHASRIRLTHIRMVGVLRVHVKGTCAPRDVAPVIVAVGTLSSIGVILCGLILF